MPSQVACAGPGGDGGCPGAAWELSRTSGGGAEEATPKGRGPASRTPAVSPQEEGLWGPKQGREHCCRRALRAQLRAGTPPSQPHHPSDPGVWKHTILTACCTDGPCPTQTQSSSCTQNIGNKTASLPLEHNAKKLKSLGFLFLPLLTAFCCHFSGHSPYSLDSVSKGIVFHGHPLPGDGRAH